MDTIMANILALSDDEDICDVIQIVLERACHDTVIAVSNLAQAAAAAQQHRPDLIVLEFVARMDDLAIGIPVYQRIRKLEWLHEVPVLFWMVPNPTRIYPQAQQLGVAGCIAMPSQPEELVEARDVILSGGTYYPPLPPASQNAHEDAGLEPKKS